MKKLSGNNRSALLVSAMFVGVSGGAGWILAHRSVENTVRIQTTAVGISHRYRLSADQCLNLPGSEEIKVVLRGISRKKGKEREMCHGDGSPLSAAERKEQPMSASWCDRFACIDVRLPKGSDAATSATMVWYSLVDESMIHKATVELTAKQTEATVKIAHGAWDSVATFDANGKRLSGDPSARLQRTDALIEVFPELSNANYRLMAVDAAGRERVVTWSMMGAATGKPFKITYPADRQSQPWSDAVRFRLDRRPWDEVTFTNLPDKPLR